MSSSKRWSFRFQLLCIATGIAFASGCSSRPPAYPASGKVQFTNGKPVHVGTVELRSREHKIHARGEINNDGSFVLTTYEKGDGAVAGTHDCVVVQMVMTEDVVGHRPSTIGVVDRRFATYATSGLKTEIKSSGPNQIVLVVEGIRKVNPYETSAEDEEHEHKHEQEHESK